MQQRHEMATGAAGLIERVLGEHSTDVRLEPLEDDGTAFEVHATDGVLVLRGADGVAQASALHWYLRHACEVQLTWDTPRPSLPDRWPDVERTRRSTPYRYRYHLNYVTFGYSAAFWDWPRWEREIDWMASHGVNTPLAATGHEAVRMAAYRSLGLDPETARRWIGGAAHLPWTWMGCTNGWGGPLSDDWIDEHAELGHRVVERQRSLGMRPVLPGFAGHVPRELADADAREVEWQGFHTTVLQPGTERFHEVATAFHREQIRWFGTDHLYAVDPFIEMVPPTGDSGYLRDLAASIYAGMAAVDPHAVWVLQGWPFHYHRDFWTTQRVRAFLDGIPTDRVLILDLWAEHAPTWAENEAFYGRPWAWCMVHNFGGRPALFGDLHALVRDQLDVRSHPARGDLVGFGMTMEAIENNAVVYELATELIWEAPEDVSVWVRSYAQRRYGAFCPEAQDAWRILGETVYGRGRTRSTPTPLIARPSGAAAPFRSQRLAGEALATAEPERESANVDPDRDPSVLAELPRLAEAAHLLIDAAPSIGLTDPLARDIVDVVQYVVSQQARDPIKAMARAAGGGDEDALRASTRELAHMIDALDELVATKEEYLLGRWLASARRWGRSPEERDVLERDARRLVTVWGRQDSGLHDYSGRHWSGLLTDFYKPRWLIWADWLGEHVRSTADGRDELLARIASFEQAWVERRDRYPTEPTGDVAVIAKRLLATYDPRTAEGAG